MKQFFGQVGCFVGFHDWEWMYIQPDNCAQDRVCTRCGVTDNRVFHDWGEWDYRETNSCVMDRHCTRCGEADTPIMAAHDWGKWGYREARSCVMDRHCTRCGEADTPTMAAHAWGEWEEYQSISDEACAAYRHCTVCGELNWSVPNSHLWSEPFLRADDSCDLICVCSYCGSTVEVGQAEHEWGDYVYLYERDSCEVQRFCMRCGQQEESALPRYSHEWGDWDYEAPASCLQVCFCVRCYKRQDGEYTHQWGEWQENLQEGTWEQVCQRCDVVKYGEGDPFDASYR